MDFVYKKVEGEKLQDAWRDGFDKNTPDRSPELEEKMDQFVGIAMDCVEGRRPEARGLPLFVVRDGLATLDPDEAREAIRSLWEG